MNIQYHTAYRDRSVPWVLVRKQGWVHGRVALKSWIMLFHMVIAYRIIIIETVKYLEFIAQVVLDLILILVIKLQCQAVW